MIVLRNYQKQLYDDIHNEWAKGARNVLAVAPTGSGKTSTFAKVIHDHPGASIAIAHRNELVSQISMSLARNGVRHRIIGQPALIRACVGLHVGELRRSYFDPDAAHGVAGVDTLVKRPPDNPWFRKVTLWVQDECFAAGTLVDGKPIESIRVGDIVTAFDEASGTFHQRPVTRVFRNLAPESMVRVEAKGHHVLYCTLGHPFWTKRGWVEAGNLTKLDEVLLHELRSMREPRAGNERSAEVSLSENGQHLLYEKVRDDFQRIETGSLVVRQTARPAGKSWMPDVWRALRSLRAQGGPIPENWSGLLQSGMLEQVPGAAVFRDRKQNEPEVCLGANAGQQPDAQGGKPGQGERDPEGEGAPADRARREREASVESGGDVGTSFSRSGLLCPTPNQDGEESREPSEAPALLQTRLGQSGIEDCAGGGWEQPQFVGAEGARCEKGSDLEWVGLDGIEVYQRGDSGTAGPSSDDGYVYNLEVAEFHTYVANGVVVHNCHHLLADNKWGKATALFPNAKGLGVTATPTRADGRGLGRHADGLMDVMVESPGMRDLIGMGFLTDYRIFAPPSDINLASVPISASGDFSPEPLRAAVHKSHIVGDVVSHYLRIAPGKLGVTFAVDVESATEIAAAYRQAGVPSEVVSANTPPALRAAILSRFARGELKQLLNVDLFGEGFDLPAIEVVGMARPTQSFALYCLDPDTEVLTPDGWLRYGPALRSREVIAFDLATGQTRVAPVTGSVCRPLRDDEHMVALESPHLSLCVSDQHDLLVRSNSETAKCWQKQKAAHVAARAGLFRVPVAGRGEFSGSGLTEPELHFLGWFLSDGGLNKSTNSITISQSSRKPAHIASIRASIEGSGFKYGHGVYRRKGVPESHADLVRFTISYGAPRGRDKHLTGWSRLAKWADKSVPACYDSLTREELLTLLHTWNLGDGANQTESMSWAPKTMRVSCGDNPHMADRLQALCVQRGLRANIHRRAEPGRSEWFNVHIKDVQHSTVAGTGVSDGAVLGKKPYRRSRLKKTDFRPEFVWCLTNPLGTLVTRRQGRVVIMGNCQQFGRSLRPLDGKSHAIIIDHVSNVLRHGLPDAPRVWTLDRRERRSRGKPDDVIPVRTCPSCLSVYERIYRECPFCGHYPEPAGRSGPEQVDGDLAELTPEALARLRGEIDKPLVLPYGATPEIAGAVKKRHHEKQQAQAALRDAMAQWGGVQVARGLDLSQAQRLFYITYGIDVASAQALGRAEAVALMERIINDQ